MTEILAGNLSGVRQRIARACEHAGRLPGEVRLLAVTKYVEPEVVDALAALGQVDVGENHVQPLLRKIEACRAPELRWRLIGHLQSNKVRKVVGRVAAILTVDDPALVRRIGRVSAEQGLVTPIFLQVNTSAEQSKAGAAPEELPALIDAATEEPGVLLEGLMTLAAQGEEQQARPCFRLLAELGRAEAARRGLPPLLLSMGMSGDLETAIEEGATDLRVGSALYEGLEEAAAARAPERCR